MIEKEISQYSLDREELAAIEKQLTIEVGLLYIAIIEVVTASESITAVELFTFNKFEHNLYQIFQEVCLQSILFDINYASKQIFINGFQQTIILEKFYKNDLTLHILQILHGWKSNDLNYDGIYIQNKQIYIASQLPADLRQMFHVSFSEIPVYNSLRKQIETTLKLGSEFQNYWHIQFYPGSLFIVSLQRQQLHLAESYCYTCVEDIIFRLVSILNTYNMLTLPLKVHISGILHESDEMHTAINKLIPDVEWQPGFKGEQILIENNYYPDHYLQPFFNVVL
jgi:hypothetical protein